MRWIVIALVAAGCSGVPTKTAGETCVASSECGKGLLCDSGKHVCSMTGTGGPEADAPAAAVDGPPAKVDATPMVDARPIDAPMPDAADPDAPP